VLGGLSIGQSAAQQVAAGDPLIAPGAFRLSSALLRNPRAAELYR
jgi:hypothetical protein